MSGQAFYRRPPCSVTRTVQVLLAAPESGDGAGGILKDLEPVGWQRKPPNGQDQQQDGEGNHQRVSKSSHPERYFTTP